MAKTSATETTSIPMGPINVFMAGFNRYGFPGVVTGACFLLLAAVLYWCASTMIPTIQAATVAMTEMSAALRELKAEVRDK